MDTKGACVKLNLWSIHNHSRDATRAAGTRLPDHLGRRAPSNQAKHRCVHCTGGSSKDDHDQKPAHKITDPKDEMSLKNRVAKEKALEKEEEEATKQ